MALTMSTRILMFVVCVATCVQAAGSVDQKAKITLACLLGGVPAVSLIMLTWFCICIKRRKRRAQKEALANGIELDADGWPVKNPAHQVQLPTSGAGSTVAVTEPPPPAYAGSMKRSGADAKVAV